MPALTEDEVAELVKQNPRPVPLTDERIAELPPDALIEILHLRAEVQYLQRELYCNEQRREREREMYGRELEQSRHEAKVFLDALTKQARLEPPCPIVITKETKGDQ